MTATTETTLLPTYFTPPLVNPAGRGLYPAVSWTEETGPARWLAEGVQFRSSLTGNYGGETSTGIWGADWCASPDELTQDDVKSGVRPDDPAAFLATTVWSWDSCDLTEPSQAEVTDRAQQVLRLREPVLVAEDFINRIAADAGTPTTATDLVDAIGELEDAFADTNTSGLIHAAPKVLPALVHAQLLTRSGAGGWVTPAGHRLVVDGGYKSTLGDGTLIATSAVFGWRTRVNVTPSLKPEYNSFAVLAERSVVLGVEKVLAAAKIGGSTT
jgi:hypothetical protein